MREGTGIGRAVWLEERRSGIGGTDAAAILGQSKYRTALDVWLEKTRDPARQEKALTGAMDWGTRLEAPIADAYADRTGRTLWNPEGLVRHPEHPFIIGSPDRLVEGERRGVEIKTAGHFAAADFGEPGTDEVPLGYLVQCVHYMAITGFDAWDLAVLIGGQDFRVYTIRRDVELEQRILARLVDWWHTHVVAGERPPLDATDSTTEYLSRRYPRSTGEALLPATQDAEVWARRLSLARTARKDAELEEVLAENNLKDLIGDAAGIDGRHWKATWRSPKPRVSVDWEAVARDLCLDTNILAGYADKHAKESAPSRRFLFTTKGV